MIYVFFFFQAEDGIRDKLVTGVQTCALPISLNGKSLSFDPVPGAVATRAVSATGLSLTTPRHVPGRRTLLTTVRRFVSFPLPLRQLSPFGLKGISAFPESSGLCAYH